MSHLDGGVLGLVLVIPQVLLIVEESVVDHLHQLAAQLGTRRVLPRSVAARVLPQVGRRLRHDQDLVDVVVIDLAVRFLVRPVGEGVPSSVHLLHLLVEHEVQLLWFVLLGSILKMDDVKYKILGSTR